MKTSAKNSPKRTSHGVARAIVKLNSLRSPSSIMAHVYNNICNLLFLAQNYECDFRVIELRYFL